MIIRMKFTGLVLLLMVSFACKRNNAEESIEKISIQTAKTTSFQLEDLKLMELETNEESMIKAFADAFVYDSCVYVASGQDMYCFGVLDGKFKYKVSGGISDIFENEGKIFAYNNNDKTMFLYRANGVNVSELKVASKDSLIYPTVILPLDSENFLIRNSYRGNQNSTLEFGLLDKNFQFKKNLKGLYVNDGFFRDDLVKSKGNFVLYAPTFADTIYSIDKNDIKAKYIIDYGVKPIPQEVRNKGLAYVANWINKNLKDEFYGMITSCYDNGENVIFMSFISSDFSILVYDKKYGRVKINKILFDKSKYMPQVFLAYGEDMVYMFVFDKLDYSKNPYLVSFDIDTLK